jgi:hypothetical protein
LIREAINNIELCEVIFISKIKIVMKKINYIIYTMLMLLTTLTAQAAPPSETSELSMAMLIFIPSALAAIGVAYVVWRFNLTRRKPTPPKTVNRGPVKRPMYAVQRKKALHEPSRY